jgi:hypothetical protein
MPIEPTLRKIVDQFAGPSTRLLVSRMALIARIDAPANFCARRIWWSGTDDTLSAAPRQQ